MVEALVAKVSLYYCSYSEDAMLFVESVFDEILSMNSTERPNPNTIDVNVPEIAGSQYFTRYYDQLCRLSVILHVLNHCIARQLQKRPVQSIPSVINVQSMERAKKLLDILTLHKSILLQVRMNDIRST